MPDDFRCQQEGCEGKNMTRQVSMRIYLSRGTADLLKQGTAQERATGRGLDRQNERKGLYWDSRS